jgi:hypothetical protein
MPKICISTLRSVKSDCIRNRKQIHIAVRRHGCPCGLALVLLASAACTPGGRQQDFAAAEKNKAVAQSGSAAKPVPFAAFTVEFEAEDPKFQVDGNFTLGPGNNGIDLMTDTVNVKIGQYSMVIPPGSFKQNERGKTKHKTEVDGRSWSLVIQDVGNGNFEFKAKTEEPGEFRQLKPEDVVLTIGDDTGSARPLSS